MCNLSVATSRQWTDKAGARQEETEWHRVTVWGKQAESCAKYLTKGASVCVEGRLRTSSYEKDGVKHYKTEIVADHVHFLSGKGGGRPAQTEPSAEPQQDAWPTDDDIPF